MSIVLDRPVKIRRTVASSMDHARALEDPVRVRILEILYKKPLSAEQITEGLRASGHKKAVTTVRHHIDVLKGSGLVQVVRIQEARGAVIKYYGTPVRLLEYSEPKDFDAKYGDIIRDTAKRLEGILGGLSEETALILKSKKSDRAYHQYVMMEIVNRSMTSIFERRGSLGGKKQA